MNGYDVTVDRFADSGLELDTAGITVHLALHKDFANILAVGIGQRAQAKYSENNSCDYQSLGHFSPLFVCAFY